MEKTVEKKQKILQIKGTGRAYFEIKACPFCLASADELSDPQTDNRAFTLVGCRKCNEKFFVLAGKAITFTRTSTEVCEAKVD